VIAHTCAASEKRHPLRPAILPVSVQQQLVSGLQATGRQTTSDSKLASRK
jgi:hypothetical protein